MSTKLKGEAPKIDEFLTSLSYPSPDASGLEEFHQRTTFTRATIQLSASWVYGYLHHPRATLETARNHKNYFLSERFRLPTPTPIDVSLSEALGKRHTAQAFSGGKLTLADISNMLHSSIRATRASLIDVERDLRVFKRPYASGGGLYPIETYVVLHAVEDCDVMVAHYDPVGHMLHIIQRTDADTALGPFNDLDGRLAKSSAIFVMTGVLRRTVVKYGARGYRFALLEAGEIAQNLSLTAAAMGLGTLPWGGAYDLEVANLLETCSVDEPFLHCLAIGAPA